MHNRFEALPISELARPTPAVVIAVGRFAAQAAGQVRRIYLRGDARRSPATAFYQILPAGTAGLSLVGLDRAPDDAPEMARDPYLEYRRVALRSAVQQGPDLKVFLERLLHEQRVHERLIEAGWDTPYDTPLNFFILADLHDPWAAGMLLPLGLVLDEILAHTNLCQAHWLLSAAVFPQSAPDQDLAVWSCLQALDDILRPSSVHREHLARAMNIQSRHAPDFNVLLFDSRKEGMAVVRDPASLNTLLGNALLALLQRDLALRFFQERDGDALFERGSYYSSIGAAALVYDPQSLQIACARRIGHIFLNEKILSTAHDGQAAIHHAHQLQEKLGGIYTWLERLCTQLPPPIAQVRIQPDTLEMAALLADIALVPLEYERVNQTPWAAQLQGYESRFEQKTLPEVCLRLDENQDQLQKQLVETLKTACDSLPSEAGLYPGGLHNARRVLALIFEGFEKAARNLDQLRERVQERQSLVAEKLAVQRQQMQALLSGAPALPWWLRILPAFARQWLAPLYLARRYGRQIYLAQAFRDECLVLLQQLCGLRIEQQALEQLQGIIPILQAEVEETDSDLMVLEEKVIQAAQTFSPEWGEFPLAAGENGWDDLFRQPVVDRSLAGWAYEQWRPNLDAWVHAFLANQSLFTGWRNITTAAIAGWVQEQASLAYQLVWGLNLEAIFGMETDNPPGFKGEKRWSLKTISTCMSAAIPPIRPDFDAVGDPNGASVSFLGLVGSPEWVHCCLPPAQNGMERWQAVYTGDPYTALFIQIRRGFPLRSLVDSFARARLKMDGLPDDQRQAYNLFMGLDQSEAPTMETTGPNSPD